MRLLHIQPAYYWSAVSCNGRDGVEGRLDIPQVAQHLERATAYGFNVQADALGFTVTSVSPDGDLYVWTYEAILP